MILIGFGIELFIILLAIYLIAVSGYYLLSNNPVDDALFRKIRFVAILLTSLVILLRTVTDPALLFFKADDADSIDITDSGE